MKDSQRTPIDVVVCASALILGCGGSTQATPGGDAGAGSDASANTDSGASVDGAMVADAGPDTTATDATTPSIDATAPSDAAPSESGNEQGDGAAPKPVALVTGRHQPWAIAVDGTSVYWTEVGDEQSHGTIMKIARTGAGGASIIADGNYLPSTIAVDSNNVYWTAAVAGTVYELPLDGGAPIVLSPPGIGNLAERWGLALDTARVYWANGVDISFAPKGGGTVGTLTSVGGASQALALGSAEAYWINTVYCPDDGGQCNDADGGLVERIALDGGDVTIMASGQSSPWSLVNDGANLYWTNEGDETRKYESASVVQQSLDGGLPITLVSGGTDYRGIAVDATDVYWLVAGTPANKYQDGAVVKVPIGGGTPTTVATGQSTPFSVAVDDTAIYWTNAGTPPNYTDGSVMTLAKK